MFHAKTQRQRSATWAALVVAFAFSGLLACGDTCPDLALRAFLVNTTGFDDPSLITVDVYGTGSLTPAFTGADLDQLADLNGGRYDLIFLFEGTAFGEVTNVCTLGSLTGCDAEDVGDGGVPIINLVRDGTDLSAELMQPGTCPAQ